MCRIRLSLSPVCVDRLLSTLRPNILACCEENPISYRWSKTIKYLQYQYLIDQSSSFCHGENLCPPEPPPLQMLFQPSILHAPYKTKKKQMKITFQLLLLFLLQSEHFPNQNVPWIWDNKIHQVQANHLHQGIPLTHDHEEQKLQ